MEEKKSNKGLIWLIVILIVLVLGLVGFIVYDKVVLDNKDSVSDNNTISTTNENYEKILYDQDNILITLRDANDEEFLENNGTSYYNFFFNGREISELKIVDYGLEINCSKYDNDYIFVDHYDGRIYNYYLLDKKGNIIIDFSKYSYINSSEGYYELKLLDNKFVMIITIDFGKYYGYDELGVYKELCNEFKDDSIVEIQKEIEYLGNGKLGEEKIVSQKTLQEYLESKNYLNCQEVLNS